MYPSEEAVENPYLQQEVNSASPYRLRWMLIQRAEELCGAVESMWSQGNEQEAAQWLLRIRDILGELLSGVQDRENPVSQSVSDFYIFLVQLLGRVEADQDLEQLQTLRGLLQIEAETWRQVVERFQGGQNPSTDVQDVQFAQSQNTPSIPPPIMGGYGGSAGQAYDTLGGESFSFEV